MSARLAASRPLGRLPTCVFGREAFFFFSGALPAPFGCRSSGARIFCCGRSFGRATATLLGRGALATAAAAAAAWAADGIDLRRAAGRVGLAPTAGAFPSATLALRDGGPRGGTATGFGGWARGAYGPGFAEGAFAFAFGIGGGVRGYTTRDPLWRGR